MSHVSFTVDIPGDPLPRAIWSTCCLFHMPVVRAFVREELLWFERATGPSESDGRKDTSSSSMVMIMTPPTHMSNNISYPERLHMDAFIHGNFISSNIENTCAQTC